MNTPKVEFIWRHFSYVVSSLPPGYPRRPLYTQSTIEYSVFILFFTNLEQLKYKKEVL